MAIVAPAITKYGRRRWIIGAVLTLALLLPPVGLYAAVRLSMEALGPPPLERADRLSVTVVDRNDNLLRAFTTPEGRWRLPVTVDAVDQRYLDLLFNFEDRRFYEHGGIDVLAMARAGWQLVAHQRIVSGASTLTMQVARLLDGEHIRTASGKWWQSIRALQLEEQLSKAEILELYLRLAPFGGNIEGVRAASLAYFGKEPRRLSVGEAALLVALPQSPEVRRPDRAPDAARRARDRVLERAVEGGVIKEIEAERARQEIVPNARRDFPKLAPHLSETETAQFPQQKLHRLTIERDLQGQLETLAYQHARALGQRLTAAMLVVDHRSGEVLAHVGSSDYLDKSRLGPIDMVNAIRSPGSTLKPMIYGLTFEAGLAHPETLIEDRPTRFGLYNPKNFDEDFRGAVTIRDALAHSLNIPAVKALNAVGPARLVSRMSRVGLAPVLPNDEEPTLAIALGGIGLSLRDLSAIYAGLARGGEAVTLMHRREAEGRLALPARQIAAERRLLSQTAAWYVTDILKDAPPPANTIGGRIAYKTGTSYGYRDAWAIGYDGQHTIAVWVGRPDGASTPGMTGRTAAAPILFDAFQRVGQSRAPLASAPPGALCVAGADLPPPLKRFNEPGEDRQASGHLEPPVLISFPPDRSELEVDAADDVVQLKAEGGVLPLTWMVDGAPIASEGHRRDVTWQPDGRGFVRLTVTDAKGRVDRVTVRLR